MVRQVFRMARQQAEWLKKRSEDTEHSLQFIRSYGSVAVEVIQRAKRTDVRTFRTPAVNQMSDRRNVNNPLFATTKNSSNLWKRKIFKTSTGPYKKRYLKTSKNLNASFQTKSRFRPTLEALTQIYYQFYTPANYMYMCGRRNESRRESIGVCWRCSWSFIIQHYGRFDDGSGNSRVGQTNANIRFTINSG